MRYRNVIITLGVLIIALRYIGLPDLWDQALYVVFGLAVIAFAYLGGKTAAAAPSLQDRELTV